MIRLLFTIGTLDIGGKQKQLAEIIRHIDKESFEVHLLCKNYTQSIFEYIENDLVSSLSLNKKKLSFSDIIKMKNYIKKIKPDMIIPFCLTNANIILVLKKIFFFRYKIFNYAIRDTDPFGNRNYIINKIFINLHRFVGANSRAGLKTYGQEGKNGRFVIYNGFDLSSIKDISTIEARQKLNIKKNTFTVSMIARIDDSKDHITLLKTAEYLKTKNIHDIKFIITGNGCRYNEIQKKISDMGLSRIVSLTGFQEDTAPVIKASDISVYLPVKEGIPNAVMESFAYKKPVIATTQTGAAAEIINDKTDGYILKHGDYEEIARRILNLKNNPKKITEMGEAGFLKLSQKFSIKNLISHFERIVCDILKDKY